MKKAITQGVLFVLLFNFFIPLFGIHTVFADSNEQSQAVIKNENLNIKANAVNDGDTVTWEFQFDNQSNDENQRLKFSLIADGQQVAFEQQQGWSYDQEWFVQDEFSASSKGKVQVITHSSVDQVSLTIQADVETTDETEETIVTANIFSQEVAGPHSLTVPSTPITETTTTESITESTAEETEEKTVEERTSSTEKEIESTKETEEQMEALENAISPSRVLLNNDYSKTRAAFVPSESPSYTEDENGKYPTNSWAPGNDKNVLNYQGNGENETTWNGDPDNTTNSYLENEESAIRKYAKETGTPGLFDVYLNVRGKIKTEPTDLVIVADWSGSMNSVVSGDTKTKIQRQKEAVLQIMDNLNDISGLNVGFIAYSSNVAAGSTGTEWATPVKIGSSTSIGLQPVSSAETAINNAYSTLGSSPKVIQEGATFTQKALLDGKAMLDDGSNNNRILVLLTDGVPTFSYHVTGIAEGNESQLTGNAVSFVDWFNNGIQNAGPYIGYDYDTSNIDGNGDEKDSHFDRYNAGTKSYTVNGVKVWNHFFSLRGTAERIKEDNVQLVAMGMNIGASGGLGANNIRDTFEQIASTEDDYYPVNTLDELNAFVNKFTGKVKENHISNGSINDPIGSQYLYEPDSLSIRSVGNPALSSEELAEIASSYDSETNTIATTNLNLGEGQEIQVHYQIRINTEADDFNPDYWYPMNGITTLTPNGDHPDEQHEFGVPSGKAPGTTIDLKKIWEEFDEDTGSRPNHLDFKVTRTTTTSGWKDAYLRLTPNEWKREKVTQLSKVAGTEYEESLYLPTFNNKGETFAYKVVEEVNVPAGYESEANEDGTVWTNKKIYLPIAVEKYSTETNESLDGAKLTLYKYEQAEWEGSSEIVQELVANDSDSIANLTPGYYSLIETTIPTGYQEDDTEFFFQITADGKFKDQAGNEITNERPEIDGWYQKGDAGTFVFAKYNELRKFDFSILKKDYHTGKALAGAIFELRKQNSDEEVSDVLATLTTGEDGMGHFVDADSNLYLLEPGVYEVKESFAPNGYVLLSDTFVVSVSDEGKVTITYDGEEVDEEALEIALNDEENNRVTLTIANTPKGLIPSTGGHGRTLYFVSAAIAFALIGTVGGFYVYRNRKGLN